ncbi:hypothetical protein KY342_04305, partial [Candidatus Woesearchaeota archaeon]|nr:hypothetical protein [Candidatus Woesearchaeota archaeon]
EWFDDYDKKTDTYGRHIVVRDPDGNLYVIDGNEFLNNLLDSPDPCSKDKKTNCQLDKDEERAIFGLGGYRIFHFGVILDDFLDVVRGYPGFSIFYDEDYYDDWLGILDDQMTKDLFGGMEGWSDAACRDAVSSITGSNVAGGAEPGTPAAFISAEEYEVRSPGDPRAVQYYYMLEFYVYAGGEQQGCDEMDFIITKQGKSMFEEEGIPGSVFVWELDEGDTIAYTGANTWLGVASNSHINEEVCIEFKKMDRPLCLDGFIEGDKLCDTISLAGEDFDYECDEFFCSSTAGFLSGMWGGTTGWEFESGEETPETPGNPAPAGAQETPTGGPVVSFD